MRVWAVQVTVFKIEPAELRDPIRRLSWFFRRRLDTKYLGGDVALCNQGPLTMYCVVEGDDDKDTLDITGIEEALKRWPIKIQVAEWEKAFYG